MPVSKVVGIDHISIRVSDYKKSKAFYSKLFEFLGFEVSDEYPQTIGWTNGKTRYWIAPAEGRQKYKIGDVGLHHYAFELRGRRDVDALQAFLEKEKVRIDARKLAPGTHILRVTATDSGGRTTTLRRLFRRCRPPAQPAVTG